jgi:hypothetical protein
MSGSGVFESEGWNVKHNKFSVDSNGNIPTRMYNLWMTECFSLLMCFCRRDSVKVVVIKALTIRTIRVTDDGLNKAWPSS